MLEKHHFPTAVPYRLRELDLRSWEIPTVYFPHCHCATDLFIQLGILLGTKKNDLVSISKNTATYVAIADQYGIKYWNGMVKCSVTIKPRDKDSCPHGVMGERSRSSWSSAKKKFLSVYPEAGVPDKAIKPAAHR